MKSPRKLSSEVQEEVRLRAHYLCEYCHTNEQWQYVRFTIDHVSPVAEGGGDTPKNLALACFHCNRRKSSKQTALDPYTGTMVSIFNPRSQLWAEHFSWSGTGLEVIPLTDTGRATVALLDLNRERILKIRKADFDVGRHPPNDDAGSNLPAHVAQGIFDELEAQRLLARIENTWDSLIPIQPLGSRAPLFCVHAAGSNVLIYRPLARHLGLDQPLYALQARGVDGQITAPFVRVEEMAANFINQIRTVQSAGPYRLLGASFGGLVIYEMAQQLLAQGEQISLLAMLDTDCPIYTKGEERILEARLAGTEEEQAAIKRFQDSDDPLIRAVLANLQAERDYTPAQNRYAGKITYFWAQDPQDNFEDNRGAWRKVAAGGFELHVIPGDRVTMRQEPFIAMLAEKLRPALER